MNILSRERRTRATNAPQERGGQVETEGENEEEKQWREEIGTKP
jgi:hypothetical protein